MTVLIFLVLLAVLFLAYSNGSNDNFKGVATLFGSGTASYRTALIWATATTLAGSLLALVLASGLVDTFKGKGLVPDAVIEEQRFLLAVSLGAALTVILATYLGMPVSTTHALTGGLVGAGLLASSGDVRFSSLGGSILLPLLLSPVVAMVLTTLLYPLFRWARYRCGVTRTTCVCIGGISEEVSMNADGTLTLSRTGILFQVADMNECVERYQGKVLGFRVAPILDGLHYLSGGMVGFARGLNDTPKMVALLIAGKTIAPNAGLALVAVVMAIGGILNARRVAETMSKKITRMNAGQGVTANLVTAGLVTVASRLGLPVSTTHVSVGGLFGIGLINGTAKAKTIRNILVAWVTTLPIAAAVAGIVYLAAGWFI